MSCSWVPVDLEVLQELVPTVKYWSFTLQPPPSHAPSQMSKKNKTFFLDEMGHLHFWLDEMRLDEMGSDEMG